MRGNSVERHNLREILRLQQRGGRMLSIVDLIKAGTVSEQAAAFMLVAVSRGASILTCAGPGGAGKTTLLADILCFLPPGERIVTVSSPSVIERARTQPPARPECYLAHEIGSGHWFGYIWGSTVRDFFSLLDTGRRIAATLHADSLDEARGILTSPPLFVDPQHFSALGLVGFINFAPEAGLQRRMTFLYGHAPGRGLQLAFRWRHCDDSHDMLAPPSAFGIPDEEYERALQFISSLVSQDVYLFEDVRERVVAYYQARARNGL